MVQGLVGGGKAIGASPGGAGVTGIVPTPCGEARPHDLMPSGIGGGVTKGGGSTQ
jgi:hypothetical protein